MPTGRLGTADLSATTYTTVYTVPATTFTVASVSVCNRSASPVTFRLALTTTAGPGTPANSEFLEFDVTILANGVLERTGIVMEAGMRLVAFASATGTSVIAMGIETSTA
jgi:hypothetical protein